MGASSPQAQGGPILPRHAVILPGILIALLPATLVGQSRVEARDSDPSTGIRGLVVDRETRRPVQDVAVRLDLLNGDTTRSGVRGEILTDEEGRFVIQDLVDGLYRIELGRLGYTPLVDSVSFESGTGLRIEAALVPEALELEPLLVVAAGRSRYLEVNGFYQREARGVGRFLTRDDIDDGGPGRMSDVLRGMSGVRIGTRGRLQDGVILLRSGCVAEVYMDGIRTIPPYPIDQMLDPEQVEAIEIYHASELPARFATTQCGAVVVWTRDVRPELGKPLTWRRALVALGFVGAVLLFGR